VTATGRLFERRYNLKLVRPRTCDVILWHVRLMFIPPRLRSWRLCEHAKNCKFFSSLSWRLILGSRSTITLSFNLGIGQSSEVKFKVQPHFDYEKRLRTWNRGVDIFQSNSRRFGGPESSFAPAKDGARGMGGRQKLNGYTTSLSEKLITWHTCE